MDMKTQRYRDRDLIARKTTDVWQVQIGTTGMSSSRHPEAEAAFAEARVWVDDQLRKNR